MRVLLPILHAAGAWTPRGGSGYNNNNLSLTSVGGPTTSTSSTTSTTATVPKTTTRITSLSLSSYPAMVEEVEVTATTTTSSSSLVRQLPPLAAGCRRVVLLRHGETDWNRKGMVQGGGYDLELNEAGFQQAQLAQNQLNGFPFGVIASSHLERSSQTADVIAQAFPHAVRVIEPKFGEMRFGSFEGVQVRGVVSEDDNADEEDVLQEAAELRGRYQVMNQMIQHDPHMAWPGGGECCDSVLERGRMGLKQVFKSFPDCDYICIVAHGRFNRLLLTSLLGLSSDANAITQGNTCINVLDVNVNEGRWKALVLNHLDHIRNDTTAQGAPS